MVRMICFGDSRRQAVLLPWLCLLGVMMTATQVCGQCTLPTSLQHTWYRADDGQTVTFTSSTVEGVEVKAGSVSFSSFECATSDGDLYIFGTEQMVSNSFGEQVHGYFCWQLVKLSDVTYFLYQLTERATSGAFTNEYVHETTSAPTVSTVCTLQNQIPTLLFVVANTAATDILAPTIPTAQIQCDPGVFATYSYVIDGAGCSGSESELNFCQDRQTARVNYTQCATEILFSKDGLLVCAGNFTIGSDVYQVLINRDTSVADSNYNRFACMKVTKSGDTETATVYPDDCAATSGTHTLALSRTVSCPIVDEEPDSGTDIVPIIAGVVGGLVAVAVIVIVAVVLYKNVYLKRKIRVVTPTKPTRNGSTLHTTKNSEAMMSPKTAGPDGATISLDDAHRESRLPPLDVQMEKSEPLRS